MSAQKYYEAYDLRYRQVHARSLQWFADAPTPIVAEVLRGLALTRSHRLLEIGCGEGRDAIPLLRDGWNLLATDVSPEAVAYCRAKAPAHAQRFRVLDCVNGDVAERFDFIFAVAVLHMLVEDADRRAFYAFIRSHLAAGGKALICTMGDGTTERCTDPHTAFDPMPRVHEATGTPLEIAGTSCRMVTAARFAQEITQSGLHILYQGVTSAPPDFPVLTCAVAGL